MPRPKGSKNKKAAAIPTTLEQLTAAKVTLSEEIQALTDAVEQTAQSLKAQKAELKAAQSKLAKLEKQEAAAAEASALEQRKADADKLADAFFKSGKSLDEIMEMLK